MVNAWTVLQGGSRDLRSPYATTSAVDYRGSSYPGQAPASPWMGEPQSRFAYNGSGYQSAYYRDSPTSPNLDSKSVAATSFSRPKTSSLEETQPWSGPKDAMPLKSCLQRGEVKEPRFYPFMLGSDHGAHALISPPETDTAARFQGPPPSSHGPVDSHAAILKHKGKMPSGFSTGNDQPGVVELITESQGQGEFHTPALTMRGAERVASDSTRRYFHARDYYDNPYMTSNSYYQTDALAQLGEMQRRKESLTAVPSTRPLTQYALAHNDAPYAPDVGDGVGLPIPQIGEGVNETWGMMPPPETRVGLMPTGFSRVTGLTNATGGAGVELPPAPPLPERFARIRARHDYLRWGSDTGLARYKTTSRVELCKPSVQTPLGGARTLPAGGAKVVQTDSSGYHMQGSPNPIPPDV